MLLPDVTLREEPFGHGLLDEEPLPCSPCEGFANPLGLASCYHQAQRDDFAEFSTALHGKTEKLVLAEGHIVHRERGGLGSTRAVHHNRGQDGESR